MKRAMLACSFLIGIWTGCERQTARSLASRAFQLDQTIELRAVAIAEDRMSFSDFPDKPYFDKCFEDIEDSFRAHPRATTLDMMFDDALVSLVRFVGCGFRLSELRQRSNYGTMAKQIDRLKRTVEKADEVRETVDRFDRNAALRRRLLDSKPTKELNEW
ncbi:MAG: hypothetical protein IJP65_01560 [Bacteroidales bacterium]|nr:hypothetical protein [Bacteroidales bacterium]